MPPADAEKISNLTVGSSLLEQNHENQVHDKKTALGLLGMQGFIKAEEVDADLLRVLIEDLMVMHVSLKGTDVCLPGPAFGLARQPVYAISDAGDKKKNGCRTLTSLLQSEGISLNAARNIFLLNIFQQIGAVKVSIACGNYTEAYTLILAVEHKLNLIKAYYRNGKGNKNPYQEIERNISALKRKIEIENNIFLFA